MSWNARATPQLQHTYYCRPCNCIVGHKINSNDTTTALIMIYKHLLLALAPVAVAAAAAGDAPTNLRGVISIASDAEDYDEPTRGNTSDSSTTNSGDSRAIGFTNACLHGRFSYSNLVADVASISVGVFDGKGTISEMDNIEINHPNGSGGRTETSLLFNSGSYVVHANGRGVIYLSLGEPNTAYYDPPAMAEFVVTGTSGNGCEITAMTGFLSASDKDGPNNDVGVSNQLVAPSWSKIAEF